MNATTVRKHIAKTILSCRATGLAAVLGWLLANISTGLAQPTLQFTSSNFSVNEAAESVTLTVQRQGDINTAVSVDYATADGTAVAGMKYTAVAGLAGPMFFDSNRCAPSEPVSILHIHGTADAGADYWGVVSTIADKFPLNTTPAPGAVRTVQIWAGHNGARDAVTDVAPTLDLDRDLPGLDTVVTRYMQHPPGGAVELWTINGGGHRPAFYNAPSALGFASRVIDWFFAHPKP